MNNQHDWELRFIDWCEYRMLDPTGDARVLLERIEAYGNITGQYDRDPDAFTTYAARYFGKTYDRGSLA